MREAVEAIVVAGGIQANIASFRRHPRMHEQRQVDRLVGHLQFSIIGMRQRQPAGDLLRRPPQRAWLRPPAATAGRSPVSQVWDGGPAPTLLHRQR